MAEKSVTRLWCGSAHLLAVHLHVRRFNEAIHVVTIQQVDTQVFGYQWAPGIKLALVSLISRRARSRKSGIPYARLLNGITPCDV